MRFLSSMERGNEILVDTHFRLTQQTQGIAASSTDPEDDRWGFADGNVVAIRAWTQLRLEMQSSLDLLSNEISWARMSQPMSWAREEAALASVRASSILIAKLDDLSDLSARLTPASRVRIDLSGGPRKKAHGASAFSVCMLRVFLSAPLCALLCVLLASAQAPPPLPWVWRPSEVSGAGASRRGGLSRRGGSLAPGREPRAGSLEPKGRGCGRAAVRARTHGPSAPLAVCHPLAWLARVLASLSPFVLGLYGGARWGNQCRDPGLAAGHRASNKKQSSLRLLLGWQGVVLLVACVCVCADGGGV